MLQKKVFLMMVCGATVVSLFLLTGCGEQKAKSTAKTVKSVVAVKSVKVQTKTIATSSNIAINPSFEEGKTFDSGLYKKGKYPIAKPVGWTTKNQILNNSTGWSITEAHTGKRSLEIKNVGGTKAYWTCKPINFKKNANAFKASIWTKTKNIKSKKGKFQLVFDVYLKGKNNKEVKKKIVIDILQTNHNWKQTTKKALFAENIIKIVPHLYFSGTTGTAWFDDFFINPINKDFKDGKILFDSNNKHSAFNIKPFSTKINLQHLSDDLSTEARKIALEEQATIYKVKGPKTIISSDFIPIEDNRIYRLSGEFTAVAKESSTLYFGYAPYTKEKIYISHQSVNFVFGTETELMKSCKANDKILYIKNEDKWEIGPFHIAFNVDSSGRYSDLPNFNLSSRGIEKINKANGYYEVILKVPCGKSYPAGTKIREHIAGGYMYNVVSNYLLNSSWTFLNNIISIDNSNFILNNLRPKTKYVKILILGNSQSPNSEMQFKNIRFSENNN